MEFTAKLDDQISAPAEEAAAAVSKTSAEVAALDAKLRAIDVSQKRAARSAEDKAKAFNPDAYKAQVKAEQELAAAKEKALEDMGMGLSKKEKAAEAEAAKRAAAEEAAAARKATEAQRAREKATEAAKQRTAQLATVAHGTAMALISMGGAQGLKSLATIAIGYQGMARMQAISYRASLTFREMFRGVDSRPLERAYMRITDLSNKNTVTGRAVADMTVRGFNGLFRVIERGTPYAEAFVQGMVFAAIKAETGWLKLRLALLPVTHALGGVVGKVDGMNLAFTAGSAVVALLGARLAYAGISMGIAAARAGLLTIAMGAKFVASLASSAAGAAAAGAPFIALAAAVGGAYAAYDQWSKLEKEGGAGEAWRYIKQGLGLEKNEAEQLNAKFEAELQKAKADRAAREAARTKPAAPEAVAAPGSVAAAATGAPAGQKAGEAIGDGVVAGMKSREAAASAGGAALARAAEQGAKSAAEIRSPSRRMRREVGAQLGAGVVGGVQDSAPRVQQAAARAFVPSVPSVGGGGAPAVPGGAGRGGVYVDLRGATFGGGITAADLERWGADLAQAIAARLALAGV